MMLSALFEGLLAQIHTGMLLLALTCLSDPASGAIRRAEAQENSGVSSGGGADDTLSHSLALARRLEALLFQGNDSDVALRVETPGAEQVKVIQAHSLVLSLQSPVFKSLLVQRNSSTLVLQESAESSGIFDQFIRYLYCGEISLRVDQAVPLHRLATKYQVQGLREGVTRYMTQNLGRDSASPAGGYVVGWYQYALEAGEDMLKERCLRHLSWNLSVLLRGAEWPRVGEPLLMALLMRSDLVLQSELELFQAVEFWIDRNQPDGMTAENALRAVRYAMMPAAELFRLQAQSPALTRFRESVRDLLYMSFQFHSASPLQMAKYFEVNCSLFTPRNYLSAAWGAPWQVGSPARDDRSASFQTQLGPSGHDASKRVTWNALFSPRWMPLTSGSGGEGRPRVLVTPATSGAEFAGVSFQKTLLVMARQQIAGGKPAVRHVYDFYQSTEEMGGDFLAEADLQRRTSDYLIDGALQLHIVVKPIYQSLVTSPKSPSRSVARTTA